MGMRVKRGKESDGRAIVLDVEEGGWAEANGILPSDTIESIAGQRCGYETVKSLLKSEPRPVRVVLSRGGGDGDETRSSRGARRGGVGGGAERKEGTKSPFMVTRGREY